MNILFLSELLYPHGGGAELATYLYAKLLSEKGINVRVVTNLFENEKARTNSGRLQIVRLKLFDRITTLKYSMLTNLPLLLSSFLGDQIRWADVVYVPLYWYSAIPLAKAYGRPVVIHLHNYILPCPLGTLFVSSSSSVCRRKGRILCPMSCVFAQEKASGRRLSEAVTSTVLNSVCRNLMQRLASMSDALICVSEAQKRLTMQASEKVLWGKLHVAYNPLPDIPYTEIRKDDFGYFGGFNRLKGFEVLYHAMKIMNSNYRVPVAVQAAMFQNVQKNLAESLEKTGFVLHGKLSEPVYTKVYMDIRSVIVPSILPEPLPYVVAEACLRGRILIASYTGGIPEIVGANDGVQFFRIGDYEELAERMRHVTELSREYAIELGMRNRQEVLKKFSNERIINDFIGIISKVI